MNPDLDEFNEDLEEDDEFEFVDHFFDCGMTTDGNCTKIGSEECEWECPYSHLLTPSTLRKQGTLWL